MAGSVIRIERKDAHVARSAEQLRRALQAADRPDVTPAEAAAVSGLPIARCEEALLHLAAELAPRVRVSEAGTLRFTFASLARPRPDARARVSAWLRRHAAGLKLAGLLMLVPPFFLTVGAHALALADLPAGFGAIALALKPVGWAVAVPAYVLGAGSFLQFQLFPVLGVALLAFALVVMLPAWLQDPSGDLWGMLPTGLATSVVLVMGLCWTTATVLFYKHFVFGTRNLFGRRLWGHVSGVLFGGDPTWRDDLSDERRLTALIARRAGVLTTADLMALFGWTPDEADSQLARILLDYGGEVVVTDEGAIAYRFPGLAGGEAPEGPQKTPEADTRPAYEREADYPAFWQAPVAFVRGFWAMVAVGVLGITLHPGRSFWPDWAAPNGSLSDQVISQAFGGLPYAFVLAIVGLRAVLHQRARAAHQARQPFLRLLRLAVEHPEGRYVGRVPERLVASLGGTIDVDRTRPDGKLWLHFPTLAASARAAEVLRAELQAERRSAEPGVAYDTAG
jgi:hypothetical protein